MTLVNKLFIWWVCFFFIPICAGVTHEDIKSSVQHSFKEHFLKDYPFVDSEDVRVVILNEAEIDDLPQNIEAVSLDLEDDVDVLGTTIRSLDVFSDVNTKVTTIKVAVKVEAKAMYLKASKRINKGDIIKRDFFTEELLDMHAKPERGLHSSGRLLGKQASSVITEGTIITSWMIRSIPDISDGDAITIFLVGDHLELKLKGRALDEGYTGDIIRVISDVQKKKVLKGEIIGPSTVQVYFAN